MPEIKPGASTGTPRRPSESKMSTGASTGTPRRPSLKRNEVSIDVGTIRDAIKTGRKVLGRLKKKKNGRQ